MLPPHTRLAVALVVVGIAGCGRAEVALDTDSPAIAWERCPGLNLRMRCGVLTVPEAHGAADGDPRTIGVAFAVSPATGPRDGDEPVLVLLGGPGGAATTALRGVLGDYRALNRGRDVVLVDQRGAGRSSPLHCTFGPARDGQAPGAFLPPEHVRECVTRLSRGADPSRYRTREFVADLELLRAALGVERWNLHGTSYGSRVVLRYMQRHPERVRSAILVGVVPPELRLPMTLGPDADAALEQVAADCAADEACDRAYPDFRARVDSIARRLEAASTARSTGSGGVDPATPPISRSAFGMAVRGAMYTGWGASQLPWMIAEAYEGNFEPLLERGRRDARRMASSGVAGLYLAVTCADDVARAAPDSALALNGASTMGAERALAFLAACGEWPAVVDREGWADGSPVLPPVLMMVGEADPATPVHWAEAAMRTAADGRLVVVPQGGHVLTGLHGMECIERLQARFLARPEPDALDVSCLSQVRRPPFVVKGAR
jgi:pimeloyl-ACP methyl ester carboxylesterase